MTRSNPRLLLIGLAYIAFVSLGLPDGLLGVAWPSIRTFFGLSLNAIGPLLISFTAGYLLSSFSSGYVLARINVGSLLALSCLATGLSLIGYAITPFWAIMIVLGSVAGFGAGAIDAGLNTYASTNFSPRVMNWLHAFFGVGATLGPLIMTAVLSANLPWQRGYLLVGVAQLVLAACFALTRRLWDAPTQQTDQIAAAQPSAPMLQTLRLPRAWIGIGIFLAYCGVEITTGQWAYTLFTQSRQIDPTTTGIWISIYWGSLSVGRIVFGAIMSRGSVTWILRLCIIAIILSTALIAVNVNELLSFIALAVQGFALAPIFPSLMSLTPDRMGPAHTANAVGVQVAAAVLGGAIFPGLVGVLAQWFSLEIIAPFLVVVALVLWILYELLIAYTVRQTARRSTATVVAE